MTQLKHWQDPVNVVLGVWLILSPWVLDFASDTAAMANMAIVGIALIAAALGAIFVPRAWEEWTELLLGLWLIASPAVLAFSDIPAAKFDAAVTGIVVTALALWVLITDKDYSGWWRGRAAQ